MLKVTPQSLDQIVRISLDRNYLVLRTELSPTPESPAQIIAPGLRGYARITLWGPQDPPELRGRNFAYLQQDLTDPHAMIITNISSIGGQIILARDGER